MPTLFDYEHACQQTNDKTQREQIALTAVSFLLDNTTPTAEILQKIAEALAEENAPGEVVSLPEGEFDLNNSLCARLEACLADFFPSIARLKNASDPALALNLFTRARILCQKIDIWRQYEYWTPLFDFLRAATPGQWQQWRSSVIAQQKARAAIGEAQFPIAKQFAIYGMQCLAGIPDHRLYLDLCSRLENGIAQGDAYYCLAIALGYWVAKESSAAGYHLRLAGMRHNLGNQLLISGKNAEAITVLEQNQQLCNEYWFVRDIGFYQTNQWERLASAYLNKNDTIRGTDYLSKFDFYAQQPREQTLHRLGSGSLAGHSGTHETAEQKFNDARQTAQGKAAFNLWTAYANLAWICAVRNKLVDALTYLQQALTYGATIDGFMNADRDSHCSLILAEIKTRQGDLAAAQAAIDRAAELIQGFDLPRRQMQLLLTKASLRVAQGNNTEAQLLRDQAIQNALLSGFDASDINRLKMALYT